MAKIIIAIDGSEAAADAATTAVELLGKDHEYTVLEAVHVQVPVPTPRLGVGAPYGVPPAPEVVLAASEAARAEAVNDIAVVVRRLGMEARSLVGTGPAAEVIRRAADEIGADLVVVGSHGKGLAVRVFLGSVSHDVLKDPPCAVLVVPVKGRDH